MREREKINKSEKDSFSRVSSRRDALILSSASHCATLLANHTRLSLFRPFFLLSFPPVNFACQKVLCSGEGEEREAKKGHVSASGRITPDNSAHFWIIYEDGHCIAITFVTWSSGLIYYTPCRKVPCLSSPRLSLPTGLWYRYSKEFCELVSSSFVIVFDIYLEISAAATWREIWIF